MGEAEFKKIKTILDFALKNKFSSFYRDKYEKDKFNIKSVRNYDDFQKIPLLIKKEITEAPPIGRIFVSEDKVGCWVRTSGTTSAQPLLIPAAFLQSEHLNVLAELLAKYKVKKSLSIRPAGMLSIDLFDFNSHPKLSSYPVILGDMANLDLSARIAAGIEVDGIDTTPSALYFLIPFLKEVYDLNKIKFIRLAGEFTSEQKYRFFKSYFKNAYFHFDLGAMEARGSIALRCDLLNNNYSPRFYHPKKDFLYEIIDEKGCIAKVGEAGELVITSLFISPFPLVRYKTGESASISEFKCVCGRKQIMELFGRIGYDFLRVGGVALHRHLVEDALSHLFKGNFEGDYELHVFEEIYKNRLVPKLILKITSNIKDPSSFAAEFEKKLRVSSNTFLEKLVQEELFAPTQIEITDKFEESYKKIKIISHIK